MFLIVRLLFYYGRLSVFHNLAVPVLHLLILIVKVLSLYVDELNDDDDDDEISKEILLTKNHILSFLGESLSTLIDRSLL